MWKVASRLIVTEEGFLTCPIEITSSLNRKLFFKAKFLKGEKYYSSETWFQGTKFGMASNKKTTSLWMLHCLILLWLPSRLILKLPSRFIWAIEKPSYNSFQLRCHLKALQSTHNPNSSKEDSSLSALAIAELRPDKWVRILLVSNIFSLASKFSNHCYLMGIKYHIEKV